MVIDVLSQAEVRMQKATEALKRELATVRSGRAAPALVEHIRVDYHGVPTPLNQLAGISAPEPRLLVVQPWDRSILINIERAILKSDLGLNPANDGKVIRLPIPPLSEERRRQLVKAVHKRVEEAKVEVRNHRREALEGLRELEKGKAISQDEHKAAQEKLQRLTDLWIEAIDGVGKDKEAELMEV